MGWEKEGRGIRCDVLSPGEALESAMCDVIKIRLKRRNATRSGKGNKPQNIKSVVEMPFLKLGLPNFRWSFYFFITLPKNGG